MGAKHGSIVGTIAKDLEELGKVGFVMRTDDQRKEPLFFFMGTLDNQVLDLNGNDDFVVFSERPTAAPGPGDPLMELFLLLPVPKEQHNKSKDDKGLDLYQCALLQLQLHVLFIYQGKKHSVDLNGQYFQNNPKPAKLGGRVMC